MDFLCKNIQNRKTESGKRITDDTCGASSMQRTVVKQNQKEQTQNYRSMTNFRKGSHQELEEKNGKESGKVGVTGR